MISKGVKPSVVSRLHVEILDRGLVPDDITYDVFVYGMAKAVNTLAEVSLV